MSFSNLPVDPSHISLPVGFGVPDVASSFSPPNTTINTLGSEESVFLPAKMTSLREEAQTFDTRSSTHSTRNARQDRELLWEQELDLGNVGGTGSGGNGDVSKKKRSTLNEKTKAFQSLATDKYNTLKSTSQKVIESKILVSLCVFTLSFLLLLVVNPPIIQKEKKAEESEDRPPKRSFSKILIWSSVFALLVLLLPTTAEFWKKHTASQQPAI